MTFQVGDLINAVISFLLIALVVYFLVVLPVNKLMDHYKPSHNRHQPGLSRVHEQDP